MDHGKSNASKSQLQRQVSQASDANETNLPKARTLMPNETLSGTLYRIPAAAESPRLGNSQADLLGYGDTLIVPPPASKAAALLTTRNKKT